MCVVMPPKLKVKVAAVSLEDDEVSFALPGENIRLRVTGAEEDQISKGMVLCPVDSPCPVVTAFVGRVAIVELLEHRPIITAGYSCVLHSHAASEEVVVSELKESVDKKTKKKKNNPQFVKSDCMVTLVMQLANPLCLEEFDKVPQMGRFTLRDEGKTIAIGKVLEITEST